MYKDDDNETPVASSSHGPFRYLNNCNPNNDGDNWLPRLWDGRRTKIDFKAQKKTLFSSHRDKKNVITIITTVFPFITKRII
jgi:hypothetical protein